MYAQLSPAYVSVNVEKPYAFAITVRAAPGARRDAFVVLAPGAPAPERDNCIYCTRRCRPSGCASPPGATPFAPERDNRTGCTRSSIASRDALVAVGRPGPSLEGLLPA